MLDHDRSQLDRVTSTVLDVLGDDAVGAYLFGSAVLGELRLRSDLDVLVVSKRPTTVEEKGRLAARLLALSGRVTPGGRLRRVEVTIVVGSEVRPWRYPPRFDFQYGDWLRAEFERGDAEPWPTTTNPDLAVLITMVLLANTPLLGPPPAHLLDAVPPNDLLRAMVGDVDGLLADLDSDTTNVVLTLARIWTTVGSGEIRSKDAAADWALERLPEEHRGVLRRARAIYLGEAPDEWAELGPRLRPQVDHVVERIRDDHTRRWAV